jgi:hypothetical protein
MPIGSSDILYKYSVAAAAGDTTAGTAPTSLGDQISTTPIPDATLNNLFDDVTGDENAASENEYRCYFVHNNHGSLTWQNAVVWVSADPAGGCDIAISVDTTGVTPKGQASAQAKSVATENDPPASQTFSAPTSKATGLSIGNIPAGSVQAIWVRRHANNTPAVSNDSGTIRCEGDTAA